MEDERGRGKEKEKEKEEAVLFPLDGDSVGEIVAHLDRPSLIALSFASKALYRRFFSPRAFTPLFIIDCINADYPELLKWAVRELGLSLSDVPYRELDSVPLNSSPALIRTLTSLLFRTPISTSDSSLKLLWERLELRESMLGALIGRTLNAELVELLIETPLVLPSFLCFVLFSALPLSSFRFILLVFTSPSSTLMFVPLVPRYEFHRECSPRGSLSQELRYCGARHRSFLSLSSFHLHLLFHFHLHLLLFLDPHHGADPPAAEVGGRGHL